MDIDFNQRETGKYLLYKQDSKWPGFLLINLLDLFYTLGGKISNLFFFDGVVELCKPQIKELYEYKQKNREEKNKTRSGTKSKTYEQTSQIELFFWTLVRIPKTENISFL